MMPKREDLMNDRWLGIALAISVLGCSEVPQNARLVETGLQNVKQGYGIDFEDRTDCRFLANYMIENYYGDCKEKKFFLRTGPAYEGKISVDWNNDGTEVRFPAYFYDLKLHHIQNAGEIWVLSREIPPHLANTLVDVFLDNYVENLSGLNVEVSRTPFNYVKITERKNATKIISKQSTKIGKYPGIIATIEIANLNQLRLDPNHRSGMMRVLIAKIDGKIGGTDGIVDGHMVIMPPERAGKVLLVVGYYNTPQFFEQGLPDFDSLLKKTSFRKPGSYHE
jgi:hypothetical protein